MTQHKENYFEKHPRWTLCFLIVALFGILYGFFSIRWIKNEYTEFEQKSLKQIIHQYYAGNIIDNNVGRFIKLREHRPNQVSYERPTKNYLSHLEKNSVERKYYRLQTDQYGFIGPSTIHDNPDLKILFLGGSAMECLYMEETQRFPYLVGRLLEKSLNKKINTYNGGVSANESMHSLNILLNKGLALKPQIVVIMHNVNDLVVLRSQGSYWYKGSLKSHVQTAKNLFTRYQFPPISVKFDENNIVQEFTANLETIIAICQIRGIKPVLMTEANRVMNDRLFHRFNDIIREVGKKHQILVIDLAKAVPSTTENLYDSYHYTVKGSFIAANEIAQRLQVLIYDEKRSSYAGHQSENTAFL